MLEADDLLATLPPPSPAPRVPARAPVHVFYGGAHLFRADLAQRLGAKAIETLETYLRDDAAFGEVFGLSSDLAGRVRARVADKLRREPVEDLRIDFEDGFGVRADEEIDRCARDAGGALAEAFRAGLAPPFIGLRLEPLTRGRRAVRTLSLFLEALGPLPPARSLLVTLPKVEDAVTTRVFGEILARAERAHGLPERSLLAEIMVEHPRAIVASDGRLGLRAIVDALDGRCVAAHFGSYDWASSLGIPGVDQHVHHPACELGKSLAQLALAGSSVRLADGATTTLPIAPDREPKTDEARATNTRVVRAALSRHGADIRRSLSLGLYQGWDLHPAQVVSRYAATFAFFAGALPDAIARLRRFSEHAARATRVGTSFDDAATVRGLVGFLRQGVSCGAIVEADLAPSTLAELLDGHESES